MTLIRLGLVEASAEAKEILKRIQEQSLTLVLSTAHWLDTASGSSDRKSRDLARFIDDLRPKWMRERISLYRLEIQSFLQGKTFDQVRELAICNTVSELVADVGGLTGGGAAIVTLESIVSHLRRNQASQALFSQSYASNETASRENRKLFHAGKVTHEFERQAQLVALRKYGSLTPGSSDYIRVAEAPRDAVRAMTCEWEATKENWRKDRPMIPNRLRDLFHLVVAMPYCDAIVTADAEMRLTIAAVKSQAKFPVAMVISNTRKLLNVLNRKWPNK